MARIANVRLSIKRDLNTRTAVARATCQVSFSEFEKKLIELGLQYRLVCQLFGDDSGLNFGDDILYTFPWKYIPPADPASIVFERKFKLDAELDEDGGEDEVYAKFTLVNDTLQTSIFQNTPNVEGLHL